MKLVILVLVVLTAVFLFLILRSYRRYQQAPTEPDDDQETYLKFEQINLARYGNYSTQLLTWFSAYGAGLAATIFLKLAPGADAIHLPQFRLALWAIVVAMAAQAFMVLLNKYTQWIAYATPRKQAEWSKAQRFNCWLTSVIELDLYVDAVSVALLGWATWVAIKHTGMVMAAD
jgi:multisubunit Na+/H+ antiporter MnhC subunit